MKQKGIEIVLSDSSGRSVPSIVAFTDEERLIGDSTLGQMKKNFKNTLQFFIRLLGLNQDNKEQLELEAKYQTYKIVPLENKKIGVEVVNRGETLVLTPEQALAMYLKKLANFLERDGITSKEVVLSCPSYFSNTER